MKVKDIMTAEAETVPVDAPVRQAADKMRGRNIGCLPVVLGHAPVGFITDRDITVRVTACGLDPEKTLVRDVMSPQVVSCGEDWDVEEAALVMKHERVRRLAVLDEFGTLSGVLSLDDLAAKARDSWSVEQILERGKKP